jgi:hypothetical protein
MTPIEAAIKGNEIFCSNFYFYHAGRSIPTGYISRRICGTFIYLEFGVVIGAAVLISAFVSIDTNAKCLLNERRHS